MQSCWESEPENRPQFNELVSTISDILHSTAGYIELSMPLQEDKSYSLATEITPDIRDFKRSSAISSFCGRNVPNKTSKVKSGHEISYHGNNCDTSQ